MRSTDILIVDDELGIREVLQETLEDEGYTVAWRVTQKKHAPCETKTAQPWCCWTFGCLTAMELRC